MNEPEPRWAVVLKWVLFALGQVALLAWHAWWLAIGQWQ